MKQRSSSLPVLVLVAVLALVLGSLGTAVAGPALTQGKVKKIATKVVKKQATKLTVRNATLLDGQPASAYQNKAYRYRLPTGAPATRDKYFTFPGLPQGTYLATYAAEFVTATPGSVGCWFQPVGSPSEREGASYGSNNDQGGALTTASAIVQVGPAGLQLYCFGVTGDFSVFVGISARSAVSFTQVNTLADSTAVGTRPAAEVRGESGSSGIAP